MVWYLSRATGAPCPFARAGISLCEYTEKGRMSSQSAMKEKKRAKERQRQQGQSEQKFKRMTRRCAGRSSDVESNEEEEPKPLPRVKLTLRLPPTCLPSAPVPSRYPSPAFSRSYSEEIIDLSRDDLEMGQSDDTSSDPGSDSFIDDPMSVDSSSSDDEDDLTLDHARYQHSSQGPNPALGSAHSYGSPSRHYSEMMDVSRRSPSTALSLASLPPESEEEDFYPIDLTMSQPDREPSAETDEWDADFDDSDLDFDADAETQWESPGPRSPSAPLMNSHSADVVVKQEDVQDALHPWEDPNSIIPARLMEIVERAAAGLYDPGEYGRSPVKLETFGRPNWDRAYRSWTPDWFPQPLSMEPDAPVKQEEVEFVTPLVSASERDAASPLSPYSSVSLPSNPLTAPARDSVPTRRHSEFVWSDIELLGPEHVHAKDFDEWHGPSGSGTVRARSKTSPALPSFASKMTIPIVGSAPKPSHSTPFAFSTLEPEPIDAQLHDDRPQGAPTELPPQAPSDPGGAHVVVVHTCQPCTPSVSATQVEGTCLLPAQFLVDPSTTLGISVYQMMLGSFPLYRRIDTDFVNLTPVINHLGISSPTLTTLPNSTVIANGAPSVTGVWVPLSTAQSFAKEHPLPGLLDVFLSDTLFERFPPALHDFTRRNASARFLNQFGPHFKSTMDRRRTSQLTIRTDSLYPDRERNAVGEEDPVTEWEMDDHTLSTHPTYPPTLDGSAVEPPAPEEAVHTPLSSTEQEIFQSLCANPEWERDVGHWVLRSSRPVAADDERMREGADEGDAEDAMRMRTHPARCVTDRRPLRRSKRVANAIAASNPGPMTRSRRLGSRKTLA
jgi:hypothetical protein